MYSLLCRRSLQVRLAEILLTQNEAYNKMDKSVVDYTECAVCMERMTNPKFLPCLHTLCRHCIENLCDSHQYTLVPCPFCRKQFDAANAGELPTNVYVEELVRVSEVVENLEQNLSTAEKRESCLIEQHRDTLQQLNAIEKRYKSAEIEAKRLQKANMDTETFLATAICELERCQKANADMEASLATAICELGTCQKAKTDATEQLKNTEHQLETTKTRVKTCQEAKVAAEVCLAKEKRLCDSQRQQILELQQTQRETEGQLNDMETQLKIAKTRLRDSQHQFLQLQQTQRETDEQLKDVEYQLEIAKRRQQESLAEKERCQNAKNNVERELRRSKQEIQSAYICGTATTFLIVLLAVIVAVIFWTRWSSSLSIANDKVSIAEQQNITHIVLAKKISIAKSKVGL